MRRSVTINPQGWETVFGRYPRQYAVVLTYYLVRSRVTLLVGLFIFPFVLFGHFFVFRGPGAGASGHTGSLPVCAEQSVLCPGGAKVKVQVDLTACRFLKAQHNSTALKESQTGSRIGKVRIRLGVTSSLANTPWYGHSTLSHQLVNSCPQVTLSSGSLVWWSPVGLLCVEGGVKSLPNKEPVQERGGWRQRSQKPACFKVQSTWPVQCGRTSEGFWHPVDLACPV